MNCTLFVPDLLPADAADADLRLPHVSRLLARGETLRRPPLACEDWLCGRFGIARQHDLPLAPLMLVADGGDPLASYWLCAEPVRLRVDSNRLIVAARVDDYSTAEAADLLAALNRHFSADGIEFVAPTPARWYARAARAPALMTTPLAHALNHSVKHHLPCGADALAWHRVINEAQMILHTHPVNAAREARGATVANSIWLWGGGTSPPFSNSPYTATWGGGVIMRALGGAAEIAQHELPASGAAWLAAASAGEHLVVIDAPADALRDSDATAWRNRLGEFDAQWVAPLLVALREKTLTRFMLVACSRDNLLESAITRTELRRFWRRMRPLPAYAGSA